jgi:hypothetical protein
MAAQIKNWMHIPIQGSHDRDHILFWSTLGSQKMTQGGGFVLKDTVVLEFN